MNTSKGSLSGAAPSEGFVSGGPARLHYIDWGGDGICAHLLHANGFCAGTYAPLVRMLAGKLRIVASDVRGHGGSEQMAPAQIHHWSTFAHDLKHVIENAMNPPVIGIGHSLGAVTTYIAAAEYPHLFSRIVLIDPVILPRRILGLVWLLKRLSLLRLIPLARGARRRKRTFRSKVEAFKRFASGRGLFKTWSPEFIDAYLECGLLEKDERTAILRCDPEMEARVFEAVPLNVWTYAERIRCPVLVLRGGQSDTFFPDAARRLNALISDCHIRTVDGAGHFIPMEKPEACAAEIIRFTACQVS